MSDEFYEMVCKWLRRESDRLDRTYPGIRVTGGRVRAMRLGDVAVLSGVDFEAKRDGVDFIIHARSNGIMKPVTVTGFSGIEEEPVSLSQAAFGRRVVGVFREANDGT
jgi:hypothetical protein